MHVNVSLNKWAEMEWGDYYTLTNYDEVSFKFKEDTIKTWIDKYNLKKIWDIGGNNGHFSRLVCHSCKIITCTDIDPVAVDTNYRTIKKNHQYNIIPLVMDFTNLSPGIGFANKERLPFKDRMKALNVDCIMALALIHHLSISGNCTLEMLANAFSNQSSKLLIEFVDREDSWTEKLLLAKREAKDLFDFYNKNNFETVFGMYYDFVEVTSVPNSKRTLYMMVRKGQG